MGRISGYTEVTPKNVTTGAAVLYKNFDIKTDTAETAKSKIISATQGGVTVGIELDSWYREIDGIPENSKGMFEIEAFKPTVTATLVELGVSQLCEALGGATETKGSSGGDIPEGKTLIVPKHDIADADYCENITALTMTKSGHPLIIQILNPLSTEGFEVATEYKAGGGMEVTWTGFYDPLKLDEAPIKFYVPVQG